MQLIFWHVLERQLVRRSPEELAEVLDCAEIGILCQRRHVTDRHVVNHAPPQQRHLFAHWEFLSTGLHKQPTPS